MVQPASPNFAPPLHRASPPPLPVALRFEATAFDELPKPLLLDIRLRLTNHEVRGDLKDDGNGAGSQFKELIDDHCYGVVDARDWHAVTAWPDSRFCGPIAWTLLRPGPPGSLRIGLYTAPQWRQRGIAAHLVHEAMRLAHRLGYKRLVANPWNSRSHAFFSASGFTITGTYAGVKSGFAELAIPTDLPATRPVRCRPPEELPNG